MTTPQTPVGALAAQARVFAYDIQAHHISDALADKVSELLNQCADQLEASARALAVQEAAAKGDKALLDFLSEQVKGDTTICPPGQHGGADSAWLVSIETGERDRYGAFCNEHEGATLRDAIRAASDRKGGV